MKTSNKTLSASEIRNLNIQESDVLSYEYLWEDGVDNHYLNCNGKSIVSFSNPNARELTFNKIKRMGFGLGWKAPLLTDEENGIIQAAENGENPFAYSIMCANPAMNKIVPVK